MAGPLTAQTIQEEAKAASTEECMHSSCGVQIFIYCWEANPGFRNESPGEPQLMTEQGNPGIYVQIDEWLPLYKGNIYVVDEVTGRMYLSKGEHFMRDCRDS